MKFRLVELYLTFRKSKECITFEDFTYFHGQMGAGKSSIARLADFCLGGELGESEMTPALQNEFVSATLVLQIGDSNLELHRESTSSSIRAAWGDGDEKFEVIVPARKSSGEVLLGTGVEILSDLIYYLAGIVPPKVRRSKIKDESNLARLSIRNLLWYCYLDQDSMDSSFFHLERGGDKWKRLQSLDVLRLILGFYQEKVSELEVELESTRTKRLEIQAGAAALQNALRAAGYTSESELVELSASLKNEILAYKLEVSTTRQDLESKRPHAVNTLQERGRILSLAIMELQGAILSITDTLHKDKAHKNELISLGSKFRRSRSAREVLGGVDFRNCPRCVRTLPVYPVGSCQVCGQVHVDDGNNSANDDKACQSDLDARLLELSEIIEQYELQLSKSKKKLVALENEKESLDSELSRVSADYDSAYLSCALEAEKRVAALHQQMRDLSGFRILFDEAAILWSMGEELLTEEKKIRAALKEVRNSAEKDTRNLTRLKELFLDCLVRAKLPGFYSDDEVAMEAPYFLPEVSSAGAGDLAVTSFGNLGSGGKKTIFKCCFAVAVHRLAAEIHAYLPTFIIIDSPMKNISERKNRAQFEGFFDMLYDLASSELRDTQFVVIDKELRPPPAEFEKTFAERHMTPNDSSSTAKGNPYPPLIRYYEGK